MSGRLIILPKKSYAPWKPENVERVLRDERRERERVEREEAARLQAESEARIQLLKNGGKSKDQNNEEKKLTNRNYTNHDEDAVSTHTEMRHVNLFEQKERQMTDGAVAGKPVGAYDKDSSNANKKKSGSGILPMYLGGDEAARRRLGGDKALPFYLRVDRQHETGEESPGRNQDQAKDDRLKARMDPMHQFLTDECGGKPAKKARAVGERNDLPESASTHVENKLQIRHDGKDKGRRSRRRDRSECTYGSDDGSSRASASSMSTEEARKRRSREKGGRRKHRRKHSSSTETSDKRRRKTSKRRHGSKSRRDEQHVRSKMASKKHDGDNVGNGGNNTEKDDLTSVTELRRRRELRERKEAERSFMLQLEHDSLSASHARSSTQGKYQDQYNPTLSRR